MQISMFFADWLVYSGITLVKSVETGIEYDKKLSKPLGI